MAITGISEFTFGYAFLFEHTHRHWGDLKATPVLPSLQQEQDLGWDAHLPTSGTDYYYQFKLSDYLWAGHAKFRKNGTYNAPYFRIALHRNDNNRQHRRLRQHSANHPETYYVAPEFTKLKEFNDSFLARQITQYSRMIPIVDCDDINDGEQHFITYQTGNQQWKQHSTPKTHGRSEFGKDIEDVYRRSKPEWKPIDRIFAETLFDQTRERIMVQLEREGPGELESVRPLLERRVEDQTRGGLLRSASDLISVFYGATMVIVGTPE